MKKNLQFLILIALLAAIAPFAAMAQPTTFFYDDFSTGSTTNGLSVRGGSPTASYTSYDIASTKPTIPGTNGVTIAPHDLKLALGASTASGFLEAQALFVTNSPGATNAIALAQIGDYIDVQVVFTNTYGTLLQGGASALWLGLYNSGGGYPTNFPTPGWMAQSGLGANPTNNWGNCQGWQGYFAQMENGGSATRISTRPVQDGTVVTNANQDLVGNGVGGGAFKNPAGTTLETASGSPQFTFTTGGTYTMELKIILSAPGYLAISNYLYAGAGTNGTVLLSHGTANVTGGNVLATAFDGLAIGALNKTSGYDPAMDISSILISGQSSAISGPPIITLQPAPVFVATNGACAFIVNASGYSVTYQWHRNGTNLNAGGNISVVNSSDGTSSLLVITNAGTGDVVTNYYVTVSGAGGYSTNSVTNSLSLIQATNLFYSGTGPWDVNNSPNWNTTDDQGQEIVFNFGDPVSFSDGGAGGTCSLNGPYLSALSVTVNSSYNYTWNGSGSFAGPGNLIYSGSAQFTINNANTYTGGTIISNASANLRLGNAGGLGTGPVNLVAGQIDVLSGASGTSKIIPSDFIVTSNFTFMVDATNNAYWRSV